jgi:D-methionine transport system substrate-binding protein
MTLSRRRFAALAAAAMLAPGIGLSTARARQVTPLAEAATLKIGATPVPHAEVLRFVQDNLLDGTNLELEIVEFTDYVQPNIALDDEELDANYFQHLPYLEEFTSERDMDLTPVVPVHIEPLGLYSSSITSIDELEDGATIAIPNDVTNGGRALNLLAANGLITVEEGVENPSVRDIDNPRDFEFVELEAAQLPRSLEDADASVINGNYAIESGFNPAEDALVLESGEGNPYANYLVVRSGDEQRPEIALLAGLLNTQAVYDFIVSTYQGGVLPAFTPVEGTGTPAATPDA